MYFIKSNDLCDRYYQFSSFSRIIPKSFLPSVIIAKLLKTFCQHRWLGSHAVVECFNPDY